MTRDPAEPFAAVRNPSPGDDGDLCWKVPVTFSARDLMLAFCKHECKFMDSASVLKKNSIKATACINCFVYLLIMYARNTLGLCSLVCNAFHCVK